MGNQTQTWVRALGLVLLLCSPMRSAAQTTTDTASVDTFAEASAATEVAAESEPVAGESSHELLTLGVFGGLVVPRSSLGVAPTVGIVGSYALTDELRFVGAVDWALLSLQQSTLLSPPQYPRSLGDLVQNTHVVNVSVGAGYKLLAVGSGELVAAVAFLLSVTSTTFEVYDTIHRDGDVGPGVEAQLVLSEPMGPLRLRLHVAYREMLHDLGVSGRFGENVLSAFVAGAGLAVAL
jgi:hypothetical protein